MHIKPSGKTWRRKRGIIHGHQGARSSSISIFAISITHGDLAVLDVEDAVIGQRHAVGVAAEVITHGLWRTERLFGVNHPVLFPQGLGIPVPMYPLSPSPPFPPSLSRWDFSFITGLL